MLSSMLHRLISREIFPDEPIKATRDKFEVSRLVDGEGGTGNIAGGGQVSFIQAILIINQGCRDTHFKK